MPVLLLVVLIPLAYLSSYAALLCPKEDEISRRGGGSWGRVPAYRLGGGWAEAGYEPLNQLDRWVRPDYWKWHSYSLRYKKAIPDGDASTAQVVP